MKVHGITTSALAKALNDMLMVTHTTGCLRKVKHMARVSTPGKMVKFTMVNGTKV